MFEELNCIELSGEKYPIKCDLLVLEAIQKKFGDVKTFEDGIIPWEPKRDENGDEVIEDGRTVYQGKLPDMSAVIEGLFLMAKEGEAIRAEKAGEPPRELSRENLARIVDISPRNLAEQLHNEFFRCFYVKNGKTTQNQRNQKDKKEK